MTGITAIYAGIAYFILAYDITLLGEQFTFDDSDDRLGYAIGVFGLTTTPLALIEYVDFRPSETLGIFIWTTGIIAYFVTISAAQSRQRE